MSDKDLARYLRALPRKMSEREVQTAQAKRDHERGTRYVTGQHAEYGAAAH